MIHGIAASAIVFGESAEKANQGMIDQFENVNVPITLMDSSMVSKDLSDYDCIAVTNAYDLTSDQFTALIDHVRSGDGSIILAMKSVGPYEIFKWCPATIDKFDLHLSA